MGKEFCMNIEKLQHKLGPLFTKVDGKWKFSGKWAYYFYETYGLDIDTQNELIRNWEVNIHEQA